MRKQFILTVASAVAGLVLLFYCGRPVSLDNGHLRFPEDIAFGVSSSRERSSRWPTVRAEHLKKNPECIACGGTENLAVHHIVSFSVDPSKELDPGNLCTLCTKNKFGMNDHFVFGHAGNWKCRNPNVVRDSVQFREMIDGKVCGETKRK